MNRLGRSDDTDGPIQDDLRAQIAAAVQDRGSVLVWDTVAIFPFSGTELLEPEYCNRIGEIVVQMLLARDPQRQGRLRAAAPSPTCTP